MKKALFFHTLSSVLLAILFVFAGCISTPTSEGEPEIFKDNIWELLKRGDSKAKDHFLGEVEVNAYDDEGRTPLHYAAERGDSQLASFFINLGANPNALDHKNMSPLGISIDKNDAKTAEVLVSGKADIHLPILDNTSAAKLALVKGGAVFRSILTQASVESTDSGGASILHLASKDGRVQAVSDILAIPSSSSTINKTDNNKKKALDYALERPESKNHIDIAEQLILKGAVCENSIFKYFAPAVRSANYNMIRNEGLAPIHYAVMNNYAGLADFLFERNIDVNVKSSSGSTPLHEAARTGNIDFMKVLIERGANVNSADANGNTPLHMGIPENVHKEAINLLLENGANPNLRDEHGDTPLHIVIILNRSADVIQTLLGGAGDVHIRNMDGKTPLFIAIQEKRTALIPHLLSYSSEVFAADNSGVTPFSLALSSDNWDVFPLVVTAETVNQRDTAGNTMLHTAVRLRGSPRHIGIILDQRAIVDARNRVGDTALHIAVRMNQRENGEFLISRGASIFILNSAGESPIYLALSLSSGMRMWMLNSTTIIAKDGLGNNILHYAAQWKLDNAIPVIIQRGLSVEEANATGETPLFMAVKADSPSTINALINNKANLNARDKQGNSLLHTAVRWNAKESASLLISSGIDINAYSMNGSTALHDAVLFGMADIEDILLSKGANLEARNIDGNTPFMEAVRAGMSASIEKLSNKGADTSARNNNGDTPLHTAVAAGNFDTINLLLRLGASIHARNTSNRTPFQNSIHISENMVSTLLTRNRINIPDDMGNSALHIALQENASPGIIRTIISRGVRVNAVDRNGQTPLRLAVDLNLLEAVKILAEAEADPFITASDNRSSAEIAFTRGEDCIRAIFSGKAINAKDSSSNTILHLAARYGNPQIIRTLIELGANKTLRNIASEAPVDIAVKWKRTENADLLR